MKEDKLVTIAIHTPQKAYILKQVLEERGINTHLVSVSQKVDDTSLGLAVRVDKEDVMNAISVIENKKLFRYDDEKISKIDDGRKRILVAVDFSSYSIKACRAAFTIAQQTNAKVKILHVYRVHFPITFPFADNLNKDDGDDVLSVARRRMLDFCNEIDEKITQKEFPPINYSYSLREGLISEEIENFVEEYKPFLLVLGTKGLSNNKRNVVGNITADIIEMTNVPVMAIPENFMIENTLNFQNIAFLTNFQKRDLDAFDFLVNILKPYPNVRITLTHVNVINKKDEKWSEAELAEMKKYFIDKYPELNVGYQLIDGPNMADSINEFIKKENINIVMLNTKRRNLFGRIFLPSISRKVLINSDVALIIFR